MTAESLSPAAGSSQHLQHMVAGSSPGGLPSPNLHSQAGEDDDAEPLNPLLAILLVYGIMFLMVAAQAGLVVWRKRHAKSYDLVTLVGLWLMPALFSLQLHFWRFLVVWLLYSAVTIYFLSLCMRKKVEHTTPRLVYSWFLGAHRVSVCVGVAGYLLLLLEFVGAGPLLYLLLPKGTSITLLWYGLYLGVLGRDCAEVASDRIAASLGSGGRRLMNTANACGICGGELKDYLVGEQGALDVIEPTVQLSCKHCFHNLCVRGWTMVGKKDVCPVCNEKVDLHELYSNRPWHTQNLTWLQMLDTLRFMVVWLPSLFTMVSVLLHFLPHSHHAHHSPHPLSSPTTLAGLHTAQHVAVGAQSPASIAAH